MAYKTENGMEETVPTRMTADGVEFEVNCYYNYMGEARVGIVPVGALYVARFAVNFYDRTISHVNPADVTPEQDALLTAFTVLVMAEQSEPLAVVPMVQKTSVQSLSEAVRAAQQNYAAAGAPRGSHLDYLGEDFDDL